MWKGVRSLLVAWLLIVLIILPLAIVVLASLGTGLFIHSLAPVAISGGKFVAFFYHTLLGYSFLWGFYKLIWWFLSLTQKLFVFITYLTDKFI